MNHFAPRFSAALRTTAALAFTLLALAGSAVRAQVTSTPLTINNDGTASAMLCNNTNASRQVGLVSYRVVEPNSCAPIGQEAGSALDSQILFDLEEVTLGPGECQTLKVNLPHCASQVDAVYGQVDAVTGPVIRNFIDSDYYGSPALGTNRVLRGELVFDGEFVPCITQEMLAECEENGICTYTRGGYAQNPHGNNGGAFLQANFASTFPLGVTIGRFGNSVTLADPEAIREFLRSHNGTPGTLGDSRDGGTFAAQVLTLQLNVAFNSSYGGLVLCNTGGSLDGKNVAQILAIANRALGGGALPAGYSISDLNDLVTNLNEAFLDCKPSNFAKRNLCAP